jgi:hypothetical protein
MSARPAAVLEHSALQVTVGPIDSAYAMVLVGHMDHLAFHMAEERRSRRFSSTLVRRLERRMNQGSPVVGGTRG